MKRPVVQGEAAQQVPVATGRGSASVRAVASPLLVLEETEEERQERRWRCR